jgi:phage-related protein
MFSLKAASRTAGCATTSQGPITNIRKLTADIGERNADDIQKLTHHAVPTVGCLARDSIKTVRDFPEGARKLLGDELQLIQFGGMPKDAKPFKGVGSGVIEIALRHSSDAYRVLLALQLGERIYVLHAFQKKSKKGIATPKRDVDLIKKRYLHAQELAHEYEKAKAN